MTEINVFLIKTGQDRHDLYKELSGELMIPEEHISPYKMSLPSLLKIMRHIKAYSDNRIQIYDGGRGNNCPRHKAIAIGGSACHGCPEHLFHVVDKVTDLVVCDADMSYGDYKK